MALSFCTSVLSAEKPIQFTSWWKNSKIEEKLKTNLDKIGAASAVHWKTASAAASAALHQYKKAAGFPTEASPLPQEPAAAPVATATATAVVNAPQDAFMTSPYFLFLVLLTLLLAYLFAIEFSKASRSGAASASSIRKSAGAPAAAAPAPALTGAAAIGWKLPKTARTMMESFVEVPTSDAEFEIVPSVKSLAAK